MPAHAAIVDKIASSQRKLLEGLGVRVSHEGARAREHSIEAFLHPPLSFSFELPLIGRLTAHCARWSTGNARGISSS